MQCIRQILDTNKIYPAAINAGKYILNIFVAISSFYVSESIVFYYLWLLLAFFSTLFSYAWDLKIDFGFLQEGEHYPLREKLSYKNKIFYYTCMTINFILRFFWVLTVSPDVVLSFIRPEFFFFILSFMEVFRRGMWNFIRVELKHIEICKEFKVTIDVELPFKKNFNGEFILKDKNIFHHDRRKKLIIDKIKNKTQSGKLIHVRD